MEDVSAQISSPIFIHQHQPFAGRFHEVHPMAKKRSLPFPHNQQQQKPLDSWNPKQWEWDSTRFIAKPLESDVLGLGFAKVEPRARREDSNNAANLNKSIHVDEDGDDLRLKLGGGGRSSLNSVEEPVSRPNKRVRSGSPGSASYPMCQVDNCKEDLSHAKDYHRRHKVCELHSKATKALVAKQMQRFCQQCSRFHPLSEFDEGKRSCRRRLAGHNRRRRKTMPEDTTSRLLLPGNRENTGNADLDIVNLLAVLTRAQGNTEDKDAKFLSVPDKDQLLQILTKINSLPLPANLAAKLPILGSLNRSMSNQFPSENQSQLNGSTRPSTMDLLAVLSTTPASVTPNNLEIQLERSSQGSDSEKTTNSSCSDQATCRHLQNAAVLEFPSVGGERSSSSQQSPVEDSDGHVEDMCPNLPLQLFSSSPEDNGPPQLPASRKYFSSDSSNPSEDRSPSSSPPVVQKLFPVHSSREILKSGSTSNSGEGVVNSRALQHSGCNTSLQLFANSTMGTDVASVQNFPHQTGYTSSSGSDHSPSSLNSGPQDRTGRIIFKLFDKDPSHLPGTLRTQIYNWLLKSPSEMESYIRPGCVILSVYLSMPSSSWEQFEGKLLRYVKSLTKDFDTDFWSNGRFLVCTGQQMALHVDGKLHLFKSRRTWTSPELISVSPLAVVGGQETSVLLRGRNLVMSGTKINCSHTGDYTVKEVSGLACEESEFDEISLCNFKVCTASSSNFGRCFIEVENGLRGTSFPVIIADKAICQELRLLEQGISEGAKIQEDVLSDHLQDPGRPRSREEILHFLNELGWLFQRKCKSSLLESPDYKISRFRFLLIFSVENDFCALIKGLLDILVEINLGREGLEMESFEMLSEIHLLNRAVKRRCKKMIDLLINYSIADSNNMSKRYIFPPNLVGPGGITPLHLAACSSSLDDIVDSLTSDAQEIGLRCWNSLLDVNGLSPYAYAEMRSNHSYNRLVAQKLADKRNGQVSVSIGNEIEALWLEVNQQIRPATRSKLDQEGSCSKCATAAMRYNWRNPASNGLLNRPYIHSMLAIAAVCVCVCLFLRGAPDIGLVAPFKWENLSYGPC